MTYTIGALSISGGTLSGAGGGVISPTGTTMTGGTISGIVGGAGGLTKNNATSGTLSGANTYTGTTAVNNGTLLVNGNGALLGTSTINVGAA